MIHDPRSTSMSNLYKNKLNDPKMNYSEAKWMHI